MKIYVYQHLTFDIVVVEEDGKKAKRAAINKLKERDPNLSDDDNVKLKGKPQSFKGYGVVYVS